VSKVLFLAVGLGRGLGWVVGPSFTFAMGWVGLGQFVGGLGWAGSKKMDPRTSLASFYRAETNYTVSQKSSPFLFL